MRKRKNTLLLYTDQQRWDTIGALGNPNCPTPNLDRLVASGTSFTRAFVNCPVCMPSRMSMLSGRYPSTLGIQSNGTELPDSVECVQHLLGRVGYLTANFGKLHFRNHASVGRDHRDPYPAYGFDVNVNSDEPGCYEDAYIEWVRQRDPSAVDGCRIASPPAWRGPAITGRPREVHGPYVFEADEQLTHSAFVADRTCQFLTESRFREPFFCIAGFYAPHTPINPPRRFVELIDEDALTLPNRSEGQNFRDVSDAQWRKVKAHYYALVAHVDDQIGRILDTLDSTGVAADTLVVFTSDHGEYLGDHGRIQKGGAEDASARVPLIFAGAAGGRPATLSGEIAEAVDIVPTLLDFAEVPRPSWLQGSTLRPVIEGSPRFRTLDSGALIQLKNGPGDGYKAIRTTDFLYVHHLDESEELFDLTTDPQQLTNRAGDPTASGLLNRARLALLRKVLSGEPEDARKTGDY